MTRDELTLEMTLAYDDNTGTADQDRMAAALDVVLKEVLAEPSKEETTHDLGNGNSSWSPHVHNLACKILASRRAKFQKVKTAEERVTLVRIENAEAYAYPFEVHLDGKREYTFGNQNDAERYRLGLIAQLKESK